MSRRLTCAAILILLVALLAALDARADDPKAPPAAEKAPPPDATPEREAGTSAETPAVRATAGGAALPVGVTLLGPRPPAAIAREQLRPGVTLHGPAPKVTWPRVIYSRPGGSPSLATGLVPPSVLPTASRPALRPPATPLDQPPRAGSPGVQLAPLAAPPMTAWTAFPGGADWVPISAFPAADPAVPYPWNPATWNDDWQSPGWEPTPAWPSGVSADDWSPVAWSSPPSWTNWQPRDAWDRLLELDERSAAEDAPPAAAGPSRQD
jgi:hypothetical protein